MIESFDALILITKNFEEQKRFYRYIMGFEVLSDYGNAIFFKVGKNQKMGLFTQDHHPEGTKTLEGAKKGISHMEFGISSKNVKKMEKNLKEKGFHAYRDNFKDADGNLFHFNIDGDIKF